MTTDSKPPHGLAIDDLTRGAMLLQARIDGNTLGQSTAGLYAQAGGWRAATVAAIAAAQPPRGNEA